MISGYATSSICSEPQNGLPSSQEFCGKLPSGFCCTFNKKSNARSAAAPSPIAIYAVKT